RILKVGEGAVESVVMIGNKDRLRMVLNLNRASQFRAEKISHGYRLNILGASALKVAQPMAKKPSEPMIEKPAGLATIKNIDFRRSPDGKGRVIVNLNNPNTVVDFKQQSGELIADFINANIDAKDERRIDVIDFATPVNTVDIFRHKNNVRMVVAPSGQYKHTVTQNNQQFIIEVARLTQQELTALKEDDSGYSGETLSLNFQRIPVRAALQVIADFTGFNIITSDSVNGDLSLRLNDVPWDQALDLILQSKDLSMRQKGNVIRIAPTDELLDQERREFTAQKEVVELEPLVTELIRINYAKAEDISKLLKSVKAVDTGIKQSPFGSVSLTEIKTEENSLLSARGSVTVDSRTNTILVQDTPSHIRSVRELISKLDVPVRQIQIETRIVEATDDFSRSLGARLGFTRVTDGARLPGTSDGNTLGTVFGSGSVEATNSIRDDNVILYPDSLSVNLGADGLAGATASRYAYQIAKVGAGFLHLLDLEISALQAEGKGKIIANPKITTTDKHEARIEQGQERVFATSSLVGGGTITKKAVLSLTVTPQITPDDQIILDVRVTNDSFAGDNTLNTKQIETQTLLSNGETIVIGGIYQQDQGDSIIKTPFLGDIPFLGNLFKKRTRRDNRTELLVFLTPRIIEPDF
ncbi:MAG: type IV pilus secretin PilQ, partial [Arenicellales bacterium]